MVGIVFRRAAPVQRLELLALRGRAGEVGAAGGAAKPVGRTGKSMACAVAAGESGSRNAFAAFHGSFVSDLR